MSPTKKNTDQEEPACDELLQSIARSLNLLVKLKVMEVQGERKLKEMVLLLHSLGCRPIEIAEILGKTSNDINPIISRSRKERPKPRKRE
jgi:hypothetical protein